jgi:filamentous hemagglutinin family protein
METNMINDLDRRNRKNWIESCLVSALTVLASIGCFGGTPALANPLGPQVVNGQASFAQQGNTLAITNSPNAIINWQSFSINSGEITRFIQQNPHSSVLNRIVGQDPSQILGALQSNGRVFLINPNGILFGAGARVDVNGLVASTLGLSNQDFLAGKMNFTAGGKSASLQNRGAITTPSGGQVYLIAENVENSGIITSPQGEIVLAAGHTARLVDSVNPDLHVVVSAAESKAVNVGQIIAQGGKIGIYGALINQRGIVSANSLVVGENGKIVFKASRDTLLEAGSRTSATGAGQGGDIRILGERVALTGDAKVDVSGNSGGGTVLVGGDYQGKNAAIQNAQQSYVSADARITADAMQSGDGGKVIVWSDDVTRVLGSISARGGALSGNGGFIETSGHYLDMQGHVDTRAANGQSGTLLLDPTNIYIAIDQSSATSAGMTGSDNSASLGSSPFTASGAVNNSLLTVATLQAALGSSSVIVSTANPSGSATGSITVVDSVTWSSGRNLTLTANGDIWLDAALNGGAGGITLNAPTGGIFGAGLITAASLTAVAVNGIGQGAPLNTQVATISLSNTGNDTHIDIANTGALTVLAAAQGFSGATGHVYVTSTGALTISGPVTTGASNIILQAGSASIPSPLTIGSPATVDCGSGSIQLRAGGSINILGSVIGARTQTPNLAGPRSLETPILPGETTPEPVQQALNTTVNVINSSTAPAAVGALSAGTTSTTSSDTSKTADQKTDDKKSDERKEAKTDVAQKDSGAKKDEPAKKMYCN